MLTRTQKFLIRSLRVYYKDVAYYKQFPFSSQALSFKQYGPNVQLQLIYIYNFRSES